MIRVLIADDQALVRGGLRLILESQSDMEVVAEAADGREAVARTRESRPDVVLMDIRMPGVDGLKATQHIVDDPALSGVHILVLTTFDLDEYVYEAMKRGAAGFLLKDVPPEHLVAAVRTVAAGEALIHPTILRRLIEDYVRRPGPSHAAAKRLEPLTEREIEVLRLIGRGRTNAEIAGDLFLSEATVKSHVGRIFAKLDLRDRAQAVIVSYETGLITAGEA